MGIFVVAYLSGRGCKGQNEKKSEKNLELHAEGVLRRPGVGCRNDLTGCNRSFKYNENVLKHRIGQVKSCHFIASACEAIQNVLNFPGVIIGGSSH